MRSVKQILVAGYWQIALERYARPASNRSPTLVCYPPFVRACPSRLTRWQRVPSDTAPRTRRYEEICSRSEGAAPRTPECQTRLWHSSRPHSAAAPTFDADDGKSGQLVADTASPATSSSPLRGRSVASLLDGIEATREPSEWIAYRDRGELLTARYAFTSTRGNVNVWLADGAIRAVPAESIALDWQPDAAELFEERVAIMLAEEVSEDQARERLLATNPQPAPGGSQVVHALRGRHRAAVPRALPDHP